MNEKGQIIHKEKNSRLSSMFWQFFTQQSIK